MFKSMALVTAVCGRALGQSAGRGHMADGSGCNGGSANRLLSRTVTTGAAGSESVLDLLADDLMVAIGATRVDRLRDCAAFEPGRALDR